jgi:hypothetical protein
MSSEQRQQESLKRRENYNQNKEKGKQVETSTNSIASRVLFQNFINMNFTSTRFQGTRDFEAGPSTNFILRFYFLFNFYKVGLKDEE